MKLYAIWIFISLLDGNETRQMWARMKGDGNCITAEYELNQKVFHRPEIRFECDLKYPVVQD